MSDVDVIVLDIDGGRMLAECVASIRAQTVPARLIVFDNGSQTAVGTRLRDADAIVRSETNLGFAGGANEALRHSAAPFVALVNNDVVLDSGWLDDVRSAMERDPRLAAAQTIIRRPDGRIDGAGIDVSDGTFRQIAHGQELGTRAYTLPPTGASYGTAVVQLDRDGRAELKCLAGSVNLDRMQHE